MLLSTGDGILDSIGNTDDVEFEVTEVFTEGNTLLDDNRSIYGTFGGLILGIPDVMELIVLESIPEVIVLEADDGEALLLSTEDSTIDDIGLTDGALFDVTDIFTEISTLGDDDGSIYFTFNGSEQGGLDGIDLVIIEGVI